MSLSRRLSALEKRSRPVAERMPYVRIAYARGASAAVVALKRAEALRERGLSPNSAVNWIERVIVAPERAA